MNNPALYALFPQSFYPVCSSRRAKNKRREPRETIQAARHIIPLIRMYFFCTYGDEAEWRKKKSESHVSFDVGRSSDTIMIQKRDALWSRIAKKAEKAI